MLVYGVSGYTGRLVMEALAARGLAPVLTGRDPERVRAVAEPAGLRWRAFPVDRPELDGVDAVVNLAGPFVRTAVPLARACAAPVGFQSPSRAFGTGWVGRLTRGFESWS